MSEYQYYEFQAVDRPLSASEMAVLRKASSRAHITPASFVNDYSWGSFKGDENAWMERYFDGFLYYANWGSRNLQLRLPPRLHDPASIEPYLAGSSVRARESKGGVILSFILDDETFGEDVDERHSLAPLLPLRAELARGDLRALYLGWLLSAQLGELEDEELEPPVPPGLAELSGPEQALASFFCIDPDLIEVAARTSAPLSVTTPDAARVQRWAATLSGALKDELLTRLICGDETVGLELRRRFEQAHREGSSRAGTTRRTVRALLAEADEAARSRARREEEAASEEKARRERAAAMARQEQLASLVGRESATWRQVEELIACKHPGPYNWAVSLLIDLRDLAAWKGNPDFHRRLVQLHERHARKPSFLEKLKAAGLGP